MAGWLQAIASCTIVPIEEEIIEELEQKIMDACSNEAEPFVEVRSLTFEEDEKIDKICLVTIFMVTQVTST